MNPWTLEWEPEKPSQIKVVSSDANGLAISFMDIKITLPSPVLPEHLPKNATFRDRAPIVVNDEIIVVKTRIHHFVFPRDKPHYRHVSVYPPEGDVASQVGNIHMTRYELGTYGLHNPYAMKLVKNGTPAFAKNKSLYNIIYYIKSPSPRRTSMASFGGFIRTGV